MSPFYNSSSSLSPYSFRFITLLLHFPLILSVFALPIPACMHFTFQVFGHFFFFFTIVFFILPLSSLLLPVFFLLFIIFSSSLSCFSKPNLLFLYFLLILFPISPFFFTFSNYSSFFTSFSSVFYFFSLHFYPSSSGILVHLQKQMSNKKDFLVSDIHNLFLRHLGRVGHTLNYMTTYIANCTI